MHDDIYMLWLSSMVQHLGSRKLNAILEIFGTARKFFVADESEFSRVPLTPQATKIVLRNRNLQYIEKLLDNMHERGIMYFSREHERFPALLGEIPDPPVGIFCIGTLPKFTINDTFYIKVIDVFNLIFCNYIRSYRACPVQ